MAPAGRRSRAKSTFMRDNHKLAAVLILFYPSENGVAFPLIQRPSYDGVHSGQVGLPGGKRELEDADLGQTALRETHEEIGVNPSNIQLLGSLTEIFIPPSNFLVHPYVGVTGTEPRFKPDSIEVSEIFTSSITELTSPNLIGQTKVSVGKGIRIDTPYFQIDNRVVWGATAMMLSELREILLELSP